MNLVFCHDHRFVVGPSGEIYSPGQYSVAIWNRYKTFFDSMHVFGRSRLPKPGESLAEMNRVDTAGVTFDFLPSLSDPLNLWRNRAVAYEELTQVIASSDAVIVRLPSEIGLLAARIAHHLDKPWAVEMVACPWDALWNHSGLFARLYAPVMAWRVRRCVALAPFTLYVTRQFLQGRYPSYGRTVAVSDVEVSNPTDDLKSARLARIEREHKCLRIGQIGSISNKIKGLHTSLTALSEIRNELGSFEFHILGPGDPAPWKRMAEDLQIAQHVHFDGVLPSGSAVMEWLDDIDIFVQPSFQEGLPRTVIEAMSRGCPIIASTAGGIPELLDASMLHSPGDWRKMGALITGLAGDATMIEQQSLRNFRVAEDYSSEKLYRARHAFLCEFAKIAAESSGA